MQKIKVSELQAHPKNEYFFDDMQGENWDAFLESIKTSGIIEPIVCTQTNIIVSGHQRVKACKELNIESIMCDIRTYEDDTQILKDLIETNIRQRGIGNPNPVKLGRCLMELEIIYGIYNGNHKIKDTPLVEAKTQEDLFNELGIDKESYRRAKLLATLPFDIQNLVLEDKISPSTASRVIAKLSKEEQDELINSLQPNKKYTQDEVQNYIDKIKSLENRIVEVSQQKIKTEIVTQIKDNPETTKQLAKIREELNEKTNQYQKLFKEYLDKQNLLNKAMGESTNWQLTSHCSDITKMMLDFISDMAKYDYLAESFNEIPNATRIEYLKCVRAVQKWANNIVNTIENNQNKFYAEGEEK